MSTKLSPVWFPDGVSAEVRAARGFCQGCQHHPSSHEDSTQVEVGRDRRLITTSANGRCREKSWSDAERRVVECECPAYVQWNPAEEA